jgi:hypothetical protein
MPDREDTSRQQIDEHGFAIFPRVLTHERIGRLAEDLEQVTLGRSRAGVRHALQHPVFAALASESPLLDLAEKILGDKAFPYHATLFDKSPETNWLVVWHQDTALPLRQKRDTQGWGPWSVKEGTIYAHAPGSALRRILALRVHLDDCTAENGPLRVLPGTHTSGVLSDHAIHRLATVVRPVDCLAPQGGVLAMSIAGSLVVEVTDIRSEARTAHHVRNVSGRCARTRTRGRVAGGR